MDYSNKVMDKYNNLTSFILIYKFYILINTAYVQSRKV
jgi:hypothetical protein